jgi:hypothetical protein
MLVLRPIKPVRSLTDIDLFSTLKAALIVYKFDPCAVVRLDGCNAATAAFAESCAVVPSTKVPRELWSRTTTPDFPPIICMENVNTRAISHSSAKQPNTNSHFAHLTVPAHHSCTLSHWNGTRAVAAHPYIYEGCDRHLFVPARNHPVSIATIRPKCKLLTSIELVAPRCGSSTPRRTFPGAAMGLLGATAPVSK